MPNIAILMSQVAKDDDDKKKFMPIQNTLIRALIGREQRPNWGPLWSLSDTFFKTEGAEKWERLKIFGKNWVK